MQFYLHYSFFVFFFLHIKGLILGFLGKSCSTQAKIKNKFVLPYPTDPVKIGRLKICYWKFAVTFFLFFPFRSKLVLLKIPYFRFVSPKERYFHIIEHIFVVKKKAYLPTHLQNCWSGKGKQKYF